MRRVQSAALYYMLQYCLEKAAALPVFAVLAIMIIAVVLSVVAAHLTV
jgi:hypothetical protein